MQTIDYSCIRPNRPTAFLQQLCRLLILDEARHRPPIPQDLEQIPVEFTYNLCVPEIVASFASG